MDDRARALVVQRTGWGKSIVYFITTALLRADGAGPTLLVSPLLALMRDQIQFATRLGLRAEGIHSGNRDHWESIEAVLHQDEIDLLLISPERLGNERFLSRTFRSITGGIGLLVIDEAHCISDWGHDFRPDYQRIRRIVAQMPEGVPILATTATATDSVIDDIRGHLGADLQVMRGPLDRESLRLQVIVMADYGERLAWLLQYLRQADGSGIVYTLTVRDARRVSEWLAHNGIDAPAYHSDLDSDDRVELEQRLRDNDVSALVSTVALGMGFDKPDLAFVVHFQRPSSVVSYYQQVGRAGRSIPQAEAILLVGSEDAEIHASFRAKALPTEAEMSALVAVLDGVDSISVPKIEAEVNLRRGDVDKALKFLELDGAAAKSDGGWSRTPNAWAYDHDRATRLEGTRLGQETRMLDYVASSGCLMEFLTGELNDPHSARCGRCANCAGEFVPTTADPNVINDANRFLRRQYLPITQRKQWPSGLMTPTRIPVDELVEQGLTLCRYGDSGFGRRVAEGKYQEDEFGEDLVEALIEMIRAWSPDPTPAWVTAIPSRRDSGRVPDFARRVARALGLEYRDAIIKIRDTQQQKTMQNSFHQAQNALSAFQIAEDQVAAGPVLLVDDIVDSGWSITVCGIRLRQADGTGLPDSSGDGTTG